MKKWILFGFVLALLFMGSVWLVSNLIIGMNIDKPVKIKIDGSVPLTAAIDSAIGIKLLDELHTKIKVTDPLEINLNETLDVPLKMNLTVPLNTDVFMDQTLHLQFDLPVDIQLDQTEMPLQNLKIPFNKKLHINDSLAVDFSIPLD